jgi:DNA-binding MarR family transcriptional regulator
VQATVVSPQQLAEALGALTAHLNRNASPDMFRVLGELELSFTQLKVMFALSRQDRMAVKEIACELSLSVAAMSRSVDGLVGRGYVARHESPADRRSKLVELLPAGREALSRVIAAREAAVLAFASELPAAERTVLHDALLPILRRISP